MRRIAILALAIGISGSHAVARDSQVQAPGNNNSTYFVDTFGGGFGYRPNVAFGFGLLNVGGDFGGLGSFSDSVPFGCVETDLWDTALRYAGEFGGFRVAAFGSACTGFGTASGDVGGVNGRVDVNAVLSAGFRAGVPIPRTSPLGRTELYGEFGASVSRIKASAAGIEYGSGWVTGLFVGIGVETRVSGCPFGIVPQTNIDSCAMSLYMVYRHYENGSIDISGGGGSRDVDTDFDIFMAGTRLRF